MKRQAKVKPAPAMLALKDVLDAFPNSWLDPLLSGPDKVMDEPPWSCPDIEMLIQAIKQRIEKLAVNP